MCAFVYRCLFFHLRSLVVFFLIGENINALNVLKWKLSGHFKPVHRVFS